MTNKTKNILIIVGFIFTLTLCYQLAIKNTLAYRKEHNKLKQEKVMFQNTPKQLSLLKQKQKYYDSILNKYQIKGSSIQNSLLETINTLSKENHLKVIHFLEPHIVKKNGLTIKTYQFKIQGSYNSILKLIYHLEQETKFGEITNCHFIKKKNFRTGKYFLQAQILLKSFI